MSALCEIKIAFLDLFGGILMLRKIIWPRFDLGDGVLPRQKIILASFDLAVVVFPRLKIIIGLRKRCFCLSNCHGKPC